MGKKILIVSRAFPPISGGGVQRLVKFSIYLKELGWDVTICAPYHDDVSWCDESRNKELNHIKIIRIKEKKTNKGIIGKLYRKLKFYDSFITWSNSVISYFKGYNKFDYDVVFTSGPPHSIHKVGLELLKFYQFNWVADFRDHFTLCPTFVTISPLHKYILRKFEENIYHYAKLIITNTQTNKKEILNEFKIRKELKIVAIYNGYDFNDLKITGYKPKFEIGKINLLYLGGLRGDHIDSYFYKMLKIARESKPELINKIRINLVGDLSRRGNLIEKLSLNDIFIDFEAIPFDKVGDYILASDACLTWQNPNLAYKGTIAGKFFDYLGMKKPIYSLGQPESELDKLINENKIGIHSDVNNLVYAAEDFIEFLEKLEIYKSNYQNFNYEFYSSFNRKNQSKVLNDLLLEFDFN